MLTTKDLLAAAKKAQGIPSNYRLARVLDVPDGTVQRWHTGKNIPNDAMVLRLAEMAGLDADEVLAAIYCERTAEPEMKGVWERIAKRLHAAQAVVLAVILSASGMFYAPDAGAMPKDMRPAADPAATRADAGSAPVRLYIMLTKRSAIRRDAAGGVSPRIEQAPGSGSSSPRPVSIPARCSHRADRTAA
jgi:hypothetical protein